MLNKMRRQERELCTEDVANILNRCEYGTFSTIGADGYPYGVPVNYIYYNGSIFFHCAKVGHKLDNLTFSNNVCFTVVDNSQLVPERLTTAYSSVIIFGKAEKVKSAEYTEAFIKLVEKLAPDFIEKGRQCIESGAMPAELIKIVPEKITGKANL